MKWHVNKWNHLNGGSPRKVFEGTEKKAKKYYAASRKKMKANKEVGGLLLLRAETTHMLIMSQFFNPQQDGIVPNGNQLI
jgi:hypothetical protein